MDVKRNTSSPEGAQFTLVAERGKKQLEVAVSGTDLGWWFTIKGVIK